jgi:hypothetical protein
MAQTQINTSGDTVQLGSAAMAQSLPVALASDQTALAVTVATLPASVGQKTKAASLPVTLASDEDTLSVDGSGVTQPVSATQLPAALGQTTKAASMAVTLASDEDALAVTVAQLPSAVGQNAAADSLSVVNASDAVDVLAKQAGEQLLDDVGAVNGEPTGTDGMSCAGYTWVCVTLLGEVHASWDAAFWTRDAISTRWVRDDQFGVAGTITIVNATEGGLQRHWFQVSGCDRFYVEVEAVSDATEDCSAWGALST